MAQLTPSQHLAELLLRQPLGSWVMSRRPETSWERIAQELHVATDGKVALTGESLRRWYGDGDRAESAAS